MNSKIFFLTTSLFASTCWAEFSIKPYDKATDEQGLVVCLVETMMEACPISEEQLLEEKAWVKERCRENNLSIEDEASSMELNFNPKIRIQNDLNYYYYADLEESGGYLFGLYNDQDIIGLLRVTHKSNIEEWDADDMPEEGALEFDAELHVKYRKNQLLFQKVLELVIQLAKKHKKNLLCSPNVNTYSNFARFVFKLKGFTVIEKDRKLTHHFLWIND